MSKRVIVYIDGENFLHRVAEVLEDHRLITKKEEIIRLEISKLVEQLFPEYPNPEIRYYGTRVRLSGISDKDILQRAQAIAESQRRLKRSLTNQGIDFVVAGSLRVREASCRHCKKTTLVFKEKGVDVRMAVDIAEDAKKGVTQIIISSDSDLLPAVNIARYAKHAKVIYVHHAESPNYAMIKSSHETRVFTSLQVKNMYTQKPRGKAKNE